MEDVKLSVTERKQRYLEALRLNGYSEQRTAKALGVHRNTVWQWKRDDPEFRAVVKMFDDACLDEMIDDAVDRLRQMLDGEDVGPNQVEAVRQLLAYLGYKRGMVKANRTDITSGGKPIEGIQIIFPDNK